MLCWQSCDAIYSPAWVFDRLVDEIIQTLDYDVPSNPNTYRRTQLLRRLQCLGQDMDSQAFHRRVLNVTGHEINATLFYSPVAR